MAIEPRAHDYRSGHRRITASGSNQTRQIESVSWKTLASASRQYCCENAGDQRPVTDAIIKLPNRTRQSKIDVCGKVVIGK
ncbi:hypothetical protein BaRGS_00000772 [Batillaria attramentaria]|uniref:Uncharacterized protein n=1 Tax=Batillaria attramentaria TaxID=370345 RepID=A0ABD0M8V7_9CAEN